MSGLPLVDRVGHLLQESRGQRVLHLGCTNWPYTAESLADGSLLHLRLAAAAAELWGLDADQKGLDILAGRGIERLLCADLEHLERVTPPAAFDLILAGEVIEHLSNPGLFLTGIRRFMTSETRLILTTVNAYCGMRTMTYALRGRGGRVEPVHPDHVAYYSYSTIRHLVERHDLVVRDFRFYDLGPEHRPQNRFYKNWINDLCVAISPQLADGLIVECALP
ncbi:MAG: methyltransferase domain-containing protein [Thermoanaerobaculia bacterium]